MPFAYYNRLTAAQKRIYRMSDAIESIDLPIGVTPGADVAAVRTGLVSDDRAGVQSACQRIVDALTAGYRVPPIRMRVLAERPADDYGELHGLYEPEDAATPARITVWMRTARKSQVVAFKSFLRTVCHEVCHHLDYELFALEETFHTKGFYRRESGLANALFATETQCGRSAAGPGSILPGDG